MAFCQNCGNEINPGETFCTKCGTPTADSAVYNDAANQNVPPTYAPTQNYSAAANHPANYVPEEYKPMGAWAYFGYSLLFSIPIVGLIVNLVLCFNKTNINKRNYARSFWCWYVIVAAAIIIAAVSGVSLLSFM